MSSQPPLVGLLTCPNCGNDEKFVEVVDSVVTTTFFIQNNDGSFSSQGGKSEAFGSPRLFCAVCDEDLSLFHQRFSEMIF